MVKRASILLSLAAVVCWSTVELNACGDKFLRIGRSPRHAFVALHRASILLYVPNAKAKDVEAYHKALERAGHRPVAVRDIKSASAALSAAKYDIVITPLRQAQEVRSVADAVASKPIVLPVVPKPLDAAQAEVGPQFEHHLEANAAAVEVLTEIDRVMKIRRDTTN